MSRAAASSSTLGLASVGTLNHLSEIDQECVDCVRWNLKNQGALLPIYSETLKRMPDSDLGHYWYSQKIMTAETLMKSAEINAASLPPESVGSQAWRLLKEVNEERLELLKEGQSDRSFWPSLCDLDEASTGSSASRNGLRPADHDENHLKDVFVVKSTFNLLQKGLKRLAEIEARATSACSTTGSTVASDHPGP